MSIVLLERFGNSVRPFLADGLITAIKINDSPEGACELVKSEKFREEEHYGRSLYDPNAPFIVGFIMV